MGHHKSTIAFYIFIAAGIFGLVSDFGLGGWWGWKDAHTLSHFFFGIGFPFFWVSICSVKRRKNRKAWQIAFDGKVMGRLGDGFWLGVAITASWSLYNEIIVYQIYNHVHPSDWHHWLADQAGIITAYVIFNRIVHPSDVAAIRS